MFVCETATIFPTTIERTARGISTKDHSTCTLLKAIINTLPNAANPAALGPTDMKAVIDVGAPSYASGAHI